ncbi:MAG: hypothetical protein M1829_001501 [Trizodia sp. TS-e1964]|nr:MAG: hypothetical protein M1829_001501 [Trizodia sp. TS-e1964]
MSGHRATELGTCNGCKERATLGCFFSDMTGSWKCTACISKANPCRFNGIAMPECPHSLCSLKRKRPASPPPSTRPKKAKKEKKPQQAPEPSDENQEDLDLEEEKELGKSRMAGPAQKRQVRRPKRYDNDLGFKAINHLCLLSNEQSPTKKGKEPAGPSVLGGIKKKVSARLARAMSGLSDDDLTEDDLAN